MCRIVGGWLRYCVCIQNIKCLVLFVHRAILHNLRCLGFLLNIFQGMLLEDLLYAMYPCQKCKWHWSHFLYGLFRLLYLSNRWCRFQMLACLWYIRKKSSFDFYIYFPRLLFFWWCLRASWCIHRILSCNRCHFLYANLHFHRLDILFCMLFFESCEPCHLWCWCRTWKIFEPLARRLLSIYRWVCK